MRAIVLAGGEGTRLRPLTWRTPKPLVPLLNQPLIVRLLRHLARHGFDEITLALTRRTTVIEDTLGDGSAFGLRLGYAYEDTPLGSGGAIASIAAGWPEASRETFLVCNGDIVADLDLTTMLAEHRARGAELSISLFEVEDPSPFGVAELGDDGVIRRFVEKPKREEAPSRRINSGFWLFEPSLLEDMDGTKFNRVEDNLFPLVASAGPSRAGGMYGFLHGPYWRDVGNSAALLAANLDLAATETPDGVLRADGVMVASGAVVEGPAVIGAGCVIDAGAVVGGSVLWDRVHVGAGARVHGSILASGAEVGAGAVLDGAIVAHGARIAPGAYLKDVAVEPVEAASVSGASA